ncbi:MAG: AAA family ATPase [Muribaculaceae bacterium]|nr:AAA family ATPase [Muribaculaceae bacterium]
MKRKSPIFVESVSILPLGRKEMKKLKGNYQACSYDSRRDILINCQTESIIVRVVIGNSIPYNDEKRNVRRRVALHLVNQTERCQMETEEKTVFMTPDDLYLNLYFVINLKEFSFKNYQTYKLTICDSGISEILEEIYFKVFEKRKMGDPCSWYKVESGCVRPYWYSIQGYKTMDVESGTDLNARFYLIRNFKTPDNGMLPEVKIKLHFPEYDRIQELYTEPIIFNKDDKRYYVEFPFFNNNENKGVYYAEISCMDQKIGGFVFRTYGRQIQGQWTDDGIFCFDEYTQLDAQHMFERLMKIEENREDSDFKTDYDSSQNKWDKTFIDFMTSLNGNDENDEEIEEKENEENEENEEDKEPESLELTLEEMTGLYQVKEKLNLYEKVIRFNKKRMEQGLPVYRLPLHSMFMGSPGTGKTTVAKLIGNMLKDLGFLSSGHVVVRERSTLTGTTYGSEEEKTRKAIEEAQGGILFIDEAYQLYQPKDPRDPGKFVIETLLTALSDPEMNDWMLILAGYPEEMKRMFDMNPGFKSRIPESNIYLFEDFSEEELMDIAENYFAKYKFTLSNEARASLQERLKSDYEHREKNFGNARHVMNLIQTEIFPAMARRVSEKGTWDLTSLTKIEATDVPKSIFNKKEERKRIGFF